jgi:hypothetical protein
MRYKLLVAAFLLLAGCYNPSRIQRNYVSQRDDCQQQAEQKMQKFDRPDRQISASSRNAELVSIFSDCMAKGGWQVASPKRKPPTRATASPSLPRLSPPITAAPAAPVAAPAPAPVPVSAPAAASPAAPAAYQPVTPGQ